MNPFPPPPATRRHPRLSSACPPPSPPLLFSIFYFLFSVLSHPAQEPLQILERGPNHARVQRSGLELDPVSGGQIERTSTYTELADGLSYFDSEIQTWAEAREEIELTKTGAVGTLIRHCQFVNVRLPVRNDFGTLTKVQNCLLAINRPSSAGFYA